MKPAPFGYHRPRSLDEALGLLAELGGQVKVLAGGQSLVPLMSMRLATPDHVVDVNHVAGLDIVEDTVDGLRVGALARHATVERDTHARDAVPLLGRALQHVAHPAIRNRGTVVGSLVHGDPAAELPAVLAVLGGEVELRRADGGRTVPAPAFFLGALETDVRPGELAVAATFRRPPAGSGSAFVEVSRRQGDYALCGVAALLGTDDGGAVTGARVALLGVGPGPVVVDLAGAVTGSGSGFAADRVAGLVDAAVDPEGDIHATAAYRAQLARVLTLRALRSAHRDAVTRRRKRRVA